MSLEITDGGIDPALVERVDQLQALNEQNATAAQVAAQAATDAAAAAQLQAAAAADVVAAGGTILAAAEAAAQAVETVNALEPVLEDLVNQAVAAAPDPQVPVAEDPEGSWTIVDNVGSVISKVGPAGWLIDRLNVVSQFTLSGAAALEAGLAVDVPLCSFQGHDLAELILDKSRRPLGFVTTDGVRYALRDDGAFRTDQEVKAAPDIDFSFASASSISLLTSSSLATPKTFYLVTIDGQSWAVGQHDFESGLDHAPSHTPEFPGIALMPAGGVHPQGGSVADWIDLHEANTGIYRNETPASGLASAFLQHMQAALGFKPRTLFAVAAKGGTRYAATGEGEGLIQGTVQDAELKRIVRGAVAYAKRHGASLVWLGHFRAHGEADHAAGTSSRRYQYGACHQTIARLNAWGKALTGQVQDLILLNYQTNWSALTVGRENPICKAQLEAARTEPGRIVCVGPVYDGDHSDKGHLTSPSYRASLGCRAGYFLARAACGPGEEPLQIVNAWRQSPTVIILEYSKPIAIEADDTKVNVSALGPGKGVDFYDGDPAVDAKTASVSSIDLVAGKPTWLKVTLSNPDTGPNPRILVAQRGTVGPAPGGYWVGRHHGARAGIRSADPFHTDALTGRTLYHWACAEVVPLPRS